MAIKVTWTEPAADDLEAIHKYISKDSPIAANHFTGKLVQAAEAVADLPLSGRIVPEFNLNNVREIVLGSYRVVYRIKRGAVQILRVSHSARLLKLK